MVDHIRTLLLNPASSAGYRHVSDAAADAALARFGLANDGSAEDGARIDRLLPLAFAPDLVTFRRFFDPRTTPAAKTSVYRQTAETLSPTGLAETVLGADGWWILSGLFVADAATDPDVLQSFREAAACHDTPYALGAVLLACAYRRLMLQGGD